MDGTPPWRTDLYATSGTLMTHAESIALLKSLGVKFTPELKAASVPMPYEGDYTQEAYAQQMIDEYKAAGVRPSRSSRSRSTWTTCCTGWPTSRRSARRRSSSTTATRRRALDPTARGDWQPSMAELKDAGVNILAPPIWYMLTLNDDRRDDPVALRAGRQGRPGSS